jgi:hypothetical protein
MWTYLTETNKQSCPIHSLHSKSFNSIKTLFQGIWMSNFKFSEPETQGCQRFKCLEGGRMFGTYRRWSNMWSCCTYLTRNKHFILLLVFHVSVLTNLVLQLRQCPLVWSLRVWIDIIQCNPITVIVYIIYKRPTQILPPYRIIGQLCILRQTLTINFSQENMRYLT